MRNLSAFFLTLILTAGLLAACGDKEPSQPSGPSETRQIDTLRLMFTPSADTQAILATTEPLKDALREQLSALGYAVGTVEITVGETYEAVGEALAAGTADIGVGMPGGTYVRYDDACEVILTATRSGLSKDFADAKDWNDEMPTVSVDQQTVFYRSIIIAGPTEKGKALAAKVNAGQALTWEELSDATWSVMGETSSAGYIYPALWLQENYGKSVADLSHTVTSGSYDEAFRRLASGEVDVLATYADARIDYAVDWSSAFDREESIWGDTNVIGVTPGIYNDAIAVSKNSAIIDAGLSAALQDALINIAANTSAGKAVIEIYDHRGYQKATPADYDSERAAQELLRKQG